MHLAHVLIEIALAKCMPWWCRKIYHKLQHSEQFTSIMRSENHKIINALAKYTYAGFGKIVVWQLPNPLTWPGSRASHNFYVILFVIYVVGGGPRVVVSTAAFHARVRGSVPGLGGLKETKMFLPHPRVKVSIVGSFRDREVAYSVSDRQGSNFESCVWRTVSSQSSHHPQEVLLAQFSLYVHKGGLKPDSFLLYMWCFPVVIMLHYYVEQSHVTWFYAIVCTF